MISVYHLFSTNIYKSVIGLSNYLTKTHQFYKKCSVLWEDNLNINGTNLQSAENCTYYNQHLNNLRSKRVQHKKHRINPLYCLLSFIHKWHICCTPQRKISSFKQYEPEKRIIFLRKCLSIYYK